MENLTFWLVVVLATIAVYRLLSRRVMTPKARVTGMLRRYRALERTGLSEQECLLQLLAIRRDWKRLPHRFLAELISRLRSQEDVHAFRLRFGGSRLPSGSLSRDRHQDRPGDGHGGSCLLIRPFSASNCKRKDVIERRSSCKNWRYACNPINILPRSPWRLRIMKPGGMMMRCRFAEQGLDRFQDFENNANAVAPALSPAKCLAPDVEIRNLRNRYRKMFRRA